MPNIKHLDGAQIAPQFAEFLDLLQMRKPSWTYINVSKDKDVCKKVLIRLDGLILGAVEFRKEGGRYNPSLGYAPSSFVITSKNIEKQRGSKNSIETSDITKALQTAVKYLATPTTAQLYQEMYHETRNMIIDLPYKASKHRIGDVVSYSTRDMQMFLAEWAMEGGQTPREFPAFVRVDGENLAKTYEAKIALDNVANAFENHTGYMISRLDDDSILLSPVLPSGGEPIVFRHRTFGDIPEDIRGKYAMLKIAEKYQVFADIGASLDNGYYYVIA